MKISYIIVLFFITLVSISSTLFHNFENNSSILLPLTNSRLRYLVNDNDTRIVTFPILPHHAIESRRLVQFPHNPHGRYIQSDKTIDITRRYRSDAELPLRRRHKNDDVRRDHNMNSHPPQMSAMYQGYGTHYLDLWVGTPPQRQTVIVDTGSGITAFPCEDCAQCGKSYHTDGYFRESKSSTYVKFDCTSCSRGHCNRNACYIGMSYQEGSSWEANEVQDMAYLGGPHEPALSDVNAADAPWEELETEEYYHTFFPLGYAKNYQFPLIFGCQFHLTGLFETQLADGIMGMNNVPTAMWKQMLDAGVIDKGIFSLCYTRQPTASRRGTVAGALTMGGTNSRLHLTPLVYAGNRRGDGFYTVRIRKIYLLHGGGQSVTDEILRSGVKTHVHQLQVDEGTLNVGGVIIDSGTTDTYMHRGVANAFQQAWETITGYPYKNSPMSLSNKELEHFPTIVFQLHSAYSSKNGEEEFNVNNLEIVPGMAGSVDHDHPNDVLVVFPASHYMEYDDDKQSYTARFYLDESGGSVLGANLMQGHDVVFDVENYRVGFSESDCNYYRDIAHNIPAPFYPPEDSGRGGIYGVGGSQVVCNALECQLLVYVTTLAVASIIGFGFYRVTKNLLNRIRYCNTRSMLVDIDLEDKTMPDFS